MYISGCQEKILKKIKKMYFIANGKNEKPGSLSLDKSEANRNNCKQDSFNAVALTA
jgi:hypothetical protein